MSILALEEEDVILLDVRHPEVVMNEAVLVPRVRVVQIKLFILIAVREDQDHVFGLEIADGLLAHGEDHVVVSLRPDARLKKQDGQGERLRTGRVPRVVEPFDPVLCLNSRVVEAWSVNDIEVVCNGQLRELSYAFNIPFRLEDGLPSQPIQEVGLSVADCAKDNHGGLVRICLLLLVWPGWKRILFGLILTNDVVSTECRRTQLFGISSVTRIVIISRKHRRCLLQGRCCALILQGW